MKLMSPNKGFVGHDAEPEGPEGLVGVVETGQLTFVNLIILSS